MIGWPARLLWTVLMALLAASACTRSNDTATTSLSPASISSDGTRPAGEDPSEGTDPDSFSAAPIPVDPAVRIGDLDNGLTYFIRFNDSPGGRAELRLVVDAGSVLEGPDQLGGAHFLEHMMFNGTERFPRNELTAILESFGPRFGPDINAYTNFDETVYQLGLPTDDDSLIELGVDVLAEWASRATIDPAEVDAEIGVVLEEWRVRDQGAQGRISAAFNELVVAGSPYEDRHPIGTADAIRNTDREALVRFYEDWYRPDLMAVVAVGDFDVDRMEQWIVERFGGLAAVPDRPPRPIFEFEVPRSPRAVSVADPESPSAFAQVMWMTGSSRPHTIGDLREALLRQLAVSMFATRFSEDAARGEAPFFGASGVDLGYVRSFGLTGVAVDARPDDLLESVSVVIEETRRIDRFGFEAFELDRALAQFVAGAEQARLSQSTVQDGALADEIVAHYLAGTPIPAPEDRYAISVGLADTITLDDVEEAFADITASAPLALVVGPEGSAVPERDEVLRAMSDALVADVEPRDTIAGDLEQLMEAPAPATVLSEDIDPDFGFHTIVYQNGATVLLWPTEIADNSLVLSAQSFGGTSLLEIEDLPEAFLVSEIVSRSGVGPADEVQLERLLSDRFVGVDPYIDEVSEGLVGGSSTEDAELLFQLVHLYMTAPRADAAAVTAVLEEQRPFAESPEDVPQLLVRMALIDAYYSGDPRYFAVPTPAHLAEFDAARALDIFRERFDNAADFTFAFVGDFDVTDISDLAARYIGTLPSTSDRETFVDHQPLPPRSVQLRTIEAGRDPQGQVVMAFTNILVSDAGDRVTADVLAQILNVRLRDRIREELSASYSPRADIDLQLEPDPFVESYIQVNGDPDRLDEISSAVLAELDALRTTGPSGSQLTTAREQVRRAYELFNNPQLAEALLFSRLHPDQSITELRDRLELVLEVTTDDVREMAGIAFPEGARIEIRLIPVP